MAVPPFQEFMRPVLLVLSNGAEQARKEVMAAAVDSLNLSEADLAETLRGGSYRARSRAHWAIEYLAQAGAVERPRRGVLKINDIGARLIQDHPTGFRVDALKHLPGMQDWTRRSREGARSKRSGLTEGDVSEGEVTEGSPIEKLIEAVEDLDLHTAAQLVQRLREQEPVFLERAIIKLLLAMGYGGTADDGEHLGQSHDGGFDGVIRQDALGIERIYLQAKRYAAGNTVGVGPIREFVGALTGAGASGGVFITTSGFSSEAVKYVERLSPRVILIDGQELGHLMVQYGVGVAVTQTLRVSEVDENFFDTE